MTETLEEFLRRLGDATPTPGGGSAAALCGAIGAALARMVANLALGKEGYEAVQADVRDLVLRAQALERRLVQLITADADAYENVSLAYKMPKTSDAERAKRKEAIQLALHQATLVPLETMERSVDALDIALQAIRKGSRSAFTDAGAAGILAHAALRAAWLNVAVNLSSVQDAGFRDEVGRKAKDLQDRGGALAGEIEREAQARL